MFILNYVFVFLAAAAAHKRMPAGTRNLEEEVDRYSIVFVQHVRPTPVPLNRLCPFSDLTKLGTSTEVFLFYSNLNHLLE
jgi:hypothetical protein